VETNQFGGTIIEDKHKFNLASQILFTRHYQHSQQFLTITSLINRSQHANSNCLVRYKDLQSSVIKEVFLVGSIRILVL
jgi:hypothetical protein